jgi:hypothetical protein
MNEQPTSNNLPTDPIDNSSAPPPTDSAIKQAEVSEESAKKPTCQKEPIMEIGKKEFRAFEIISLGVQVILAGIGIWALCIYGGQLKVMRGTLEEMQRSGDQSTDQVWKAIGNLNWMARSADWSQKQAQVASENSNRLANRALDTSIESFRADQRAWFGISDFEVVQYDPENPKKPFRIKIFFRNSGKTPAKQIHLLAVFNVFKAKPDGPVDGPTDADWDTFLGFFNKSRERYVTAPNATRGFIATDSNNNIVTLAYPSIKDHSAFAYYYGQATYVDFTQRTHMTRFCILLAEPETKQLAHCGKGNYMD